MRERLALTVVAAILVAVVLPAGPAGAADTLRAKQWWLEALHIDQAQAIATGAGVVVAVVDTGVQADHPDLAGQVLPGADLDFSGNDDKGLVDASGHGTAVAGLIAALGGGPDHALGLAPGAKILPVKVLIQGDQGNSNLADGIIWAADHGAKIINVSDGGPDNRRITEAVRHALGKGALVVAATGNDGRSVVSPASLPGVVAVGATDRTGALAAFSARGPGVVLVAPGTDIVSTFNHGADGRAGGYNLPATGTSFSAPIVAGAAALVWSKFPQLSAADVVNRLIRTADDTGPAGRDYQTGFGELNVVRALTADVPTVTANPLGTPAPVDGEDLPDAQGASGGPAHALVLAALGCTGVLVLLVGVGVVILVGRSRRGRARSG
jgi:membrane-anchored mycosin MYCP